MGWDGLCGSSEYLLAKHPTKRYGNLRGDRQRHAARIALEQRFLLDSADSHGVLVDLAW